MIMKAADLLKKPKDINEIYKFIESANNNGEFKYCIPHFMYIEDSIVTELINNGFKVYRGKWDSYIEGLIIEW